MTPALTTEGMIRRNPRPYYTYRLHDEDGRVISEFDVDFEYEVSDDDGAADPYIEVTSVTVEVGQKNMLGMTGWRKFLALDIADQIQSDDKFCAGLMEGTDYEFAAYDSHRSPLQGLRTMGGSLCRGASL